MFDLGILSKFPMPCFTGTLPTLVMRCGCVVLVVDGETPIAMQLCERVRDTYPEHAPLQ